MAEQLPSPPTTHSERDTKRARRTDPSTSSESSLGVFGISNQMNRCIAPPRPLPLETIELTSNGLTQLVGSFLSKAWELMQEGNVGIDQSSVEVEAVQRMFRGDVEDIQPTILVVVDAPWTEELMKAGEVFVESLKSFVDAYVSNHSLGVDIAVEVISKTLVDDKFVSVIDYNEPGAELLARAWPGIRHTVFSTLEEYDSTKGCTTAISLLRLGYDRFDTSQNPRTVYITLDYNSSGYGWPPVLRRLQHYVDSFHMGLVVHMEHNLVDDVSFPFLQTNLLSLERDVLQEKHGVGSRDPYSKELKQGDAIGATLYLERSDERLCNPQIGTLGCWVEVKLKKENDWVKMGLSCYHILRSCLPGFRVGTYTINVDGSDVVRGRSSHPELNTSCWKADEEGIFPSSASDLPEMEHPPRMRHNINIADLEEAIAKAISRNHGPSRIAMWEEELAEKKKFFDEGSQKFGRPYFASGYLRRTSTGGRLDWALIKPDDDNRIAGNPLPAMGTFLERGYKRSEMPWEDSTLKSQGKSIRDYVKDGTLDTCSNNILNACSNNILDACSNNKLDTCSHDELLGYKQGAATGSTVGKLSVVKTFCSIEEEKHLGSRRYSIEYIFCGAQATPTRSFTGQGDAGAVVYDQEGRILGIVFRGQMPQQSKQGYTMVTPIEDVFEDIKTMSKGEVEDIRVLGSA